MQAYIVILHYCNSSSMHNNITYHIAKCKEARCQLQFTVKILGAKYFKKTKQIQHKFVITKALLLTTEQNNKLQAYCIYLLQQHHSCRNIAHSWHTSTEVKLNLQVVTNEHKLAVLLCLNSMQLFSVLVMLSVLHTVVK